MWDFQIKKSNSLQLGEVPKVPMVWREQTSMDMMWLQDRTESGYGAGRRSQSWARLGQRGQQQSHGCQHTCMLCDILDTHVHFIFFFSYPLNIDEILMHTLFSSELAGDLFSLLQNNSSFSTSFSFWLRTCTEASYLMRCFFFFIFFKPSLTKAWNTPKFDHGNKTRLWEGQWQ